MSVLLIPVIIAVMLIAMSSFDDRAHTADDAQLVLTDIQAQINRLDALEWRTAAFGTVPAEVTAELDGLHSEISKGLDLLTNQGADAELARPIVTSYHTYRDALVQVIDLRRVGREGDAELIDENQVDPGFTALRALLIRTASTFGDRAQSAQRARDTGFIAALALGGLAIAFLSRRVLRARQNLAAGQARETTLEQSERYFLSLMAGSADLVSVLDREGRVRFQSASIERMLGWPATDVVGRDFRELLVPEDARGLSALLENAARHQGPSDAIDWRMPTADGRRLNVEVIVSSRLDDPAIAGFLVNIRDQSERTALEEAFRHQALHDPLTHLPNRVLFEDRLRHAYERTARSGRSLCLLLADLDDFRDINETFGHASGDEVLIEVAERFDGIMRSEDTIARLGGDEFAILIEELESEGDGADVAERLIAALSPPIPIAGTDVYARASIGIVIGSAADRIGATTEEATGQLMVDVDLAMYEAKREGRSQFQLYAPAMQEGIRERMTLRSDLERALTRGEFVLHYQPIVSIQTGTIVGAEALIRWQHPERGLVPPMEFIPLAERTGMIIEIGRWALREACHVATGWQKWAGGGPAPSIGVNVAGSQLQQPSFVREVQDALDLAGLDPMRLVVEVTESALIEDTQGNEMKIVQLRELGVRLAIDDFGTGYSSLSYLRRFNVDILKIDKSFVDTLGHDDSKASALVNAMVAMGTSLGMEVLAEGIEDLDQLEVLRALHCDLGQGYLFSRPVPAQDLTALLRAPTQPEGLPDASDLETVPQILNPRRSPTRARG